MTEKHKLEGQTWTCDQLKANNWLVENWKKNTWPWWVGTWAQDMAMGIWSADTLFWQLSMDHYIDVYHQVKHRL